MVETAEQYNGGYSLYTSQLSKEKTKSAVQLAVEAKKSKLSELQVSPVSKYIGALFFSFQNLAAIISNHAPIGATILLISGILGITLNPAVGFTVLGILSGVLAITAIVSMVLHVKKVNSLNKYIKEVSAQYECMDSVVLAIDNEQAKNLELRARAKNLGINISCELQTISANTKPVTYHYLLHYNKDENSPKIKSLYGFYGAITRNIKRAFLQVSYALRLHKIYHKINSKLPRLFPVLRELANIILITGIGAATVGGILAGIALISGVEVFQLGVISAFAAVTGMSGPIGIAVVSGLVVLAIAGLLVYRYGFEKPLEKTEKGVKEDKIKHRAELAEATAHLNSLKTNNAEIALKIVEVTTAKDSSLVKQQLEEKANDAVRRQKVPETITASYHSIRSDSGISSDISSRDLAEQRRRLES